MEEISPLERFEVRIANEGEITMVGVPTGPKEFARGRAMEVMREGGAMSREIQAAVTNLQLVTVALRCART